jgi:low temperature requirement protein LtrA
MELFFDLIFVAAVAQVGTHLRDDYSPTGLFRFSLLFVMIWWTWLGHTNFSTRFDTDDLVQRVLTALQIFLVAVMAINATGPLAGRDAAGFVAAYAAMRLVLAFQYFRVRRVSRARTIATSYAWSSSGTALIWLASCFLAAPERFWLWALALAIDLGTPLVSTRHLVEVPHDAAHLPERYGLFSIILLGESMVAVMTGMSHQEHWSPAAAAAAALGIALVFTIWWWYFDGVDAVAERFVRSSRAAVRFHLWSYSHLPLYLGIAVAGVGVEHIITTVTREPLHRAELLIFGSALALVALALTLIGRVSSTSAHRGDPARVGDIEAATGRAPKSASSLHHA